MRIKTLFTFLFCISLSLQLLGETRGDLERQIADLKQQVATKEAIVQTTSAPWQTPRSISVSLAAAPLIGFINDLNTLPAPQRSVEASVIDSYGQLWGWDADCVIHGHKYSEEGAYLEFKDPNYRVQARLALSNFGAAWVAGQGMNFSVDAAGHVEVGMLHWHRKPCIGGGVGGDAGPLACDATTRVSATSSFALSAGNVLAYSASLGLGAVNYGCSVNLGSAGTLRVDNFLPPPAPVTIQGSMPVPVSTSGVLESRDPRLVLRKPYEIRLSNEGLQVTPAGVDLGTDATVVWQ